MADDIEVVLPRGLEAWTGGERSVRVVAGTVRDAVAAADRVLPGVGAQLLDRQGRVRPHLVCAVDGEVTRDPTARIDGRVRFLLAVSGG